MNKFVDQHNPCVLEIMPPFVLLAFPPNKVSWHLYYFKKNLIFPKIGAKTYFQDKSFTKTKYLKNITGT
jgi:hypothetical protein